ncbi:hypothetical protein VNO77_02246 [Canavalia gladiata]|uniref:Uncharacterized protein n=1 Tax=Canavalia gladiata TaxID=3824 RepID=A0AAN9MZ29_CANGL
MKRQVVGFKREGHVVAQILRQRSFLVQRQCVRDNTDAAGANVALSSKAFRKVLIITSMCSLPRIEKVNIVGDDNRKHPIGATTNGPVNPRKARIQGPYHLQDL